MTQRKHTTSGVRCAGCGREFGIIQQSHIVRCAALIELGVTTRAEYRARFGSTMSAEAQQVSMNTIVRVNENTTVEERTVRAQEGYRAAVQKHPDLARKAGQKGSEALWAKEGQKARHAQRLIDLNSKGFMANEPNKLENKLWEMIGQDAVEFVSFKFWKTIVTEKGYTHITPDFKVKGAHAVVEVYGDYWHAGEDPEVRIKQWAEVGYDCLVIWEHEINKQPEQVVAKVLEFISRNLHERGTPTFHQVG